jgi:gluconolactonase
MPLAPIPLSLFRKIGVGLVRPEDVVVGGDGRVWASDDASACAEVRADGTLRRVGRAGGKPNGINMDAQGRILIANFGLGSAPTGPLQRLDPETGKIEVVCAEVDGRPLVACN